MRCLRVPDRKSLPGGDHPTIRLLEPETGVKKVIFVLFSEADHKVYADYLARRVNFSD